MEMSEVNKYVFTDYDINSCVCLGSYCKIKNISGNPGHSFFLYHTAVMFL